MPVEISRADLFAAVTLGCLMALMAWFAVAVPAARALARLWRWYEARQRASSEGLPSKGFPETEGQRIMRANSDLSLAALDVPDSVGSTDMAPWQRALVAAAQRYKLAIPERNKQMMRADRRARKESEKYLGD